MKPQLHPIALCRTAACSYTDDLSAILPELKAAIRESSPEFHALIKDAQADGLDALDTKVRHTLWKYANRIRYRATPYGRFAAVTPVKIAELDGRERALTHDPIEHLDVHPPTSLKGGYDFRYEQESRSEEGITFQGKIHIPPVCGTGALERGVCVGVAERQGGDSLPKRTGLPSATFENYLSKETIPHRWPDWPLKERLLPVDLDAVAWLRSNGSHYRCGNELRYLYSTGTGFEMAAVDDVPELTRLLEHCREAQPKAEVLARLADWFGYEESEADDALRWLVDEQLLLTDRHPNITGPDYFERIGYVPQPEDKTYLIPERKLEERMTVTGVDSASFAHRLCTQLPEIATFLAGWLPNTRPAAMETFTEAFSRRFEQREVPLMEALDPEQGVGYGGLEDADVSGELIAALKGGRRAPTEEPKVAYGTFHRFLLNGILSGQPIQLETLTAEPPVKRPALPNTISALLRVSDGKLVVDNLGGPTASALLGRFTKLGGPLEAAVKELIGLEQQANPDVLFADIAYMAESNVDNVNRRPNLYAHELPILCWSMAEQPIALNDLRVSVHRGEVILRSASLGKRIVPRLASAYNHTRSDLSVFRFLCDLQGQGLQTGLGLRLDQLFPGLERYPRVMYGNVVLSPAKWKLPDVFCIGTRDTRAPELKAWLSETGIDQPFRCGRADQVLCFDPNSDADLAELLTYVRQQKDVYLEEALLPASPMVTEDRGKPLAAEWLVSLWHGERMYEGHGHARHARASEGRTNNPTAYIPGQEWLYHEIYTHPTRMDGLLLETIAPLIEAHADRLANWFFIRYNDGGNHLRLRLKPVDTSHSQVLLTAMADALYPLVESGIVRDVQLKAYLPELERYGHAGMEAVESVFGADSRYLLKWLSKRPPAALAYRETGVFFRLVMDGLGYDAARQLALAKRQAGYFATEMGADPAAFKRINAAYKAQKQEAATYPLMGTQLGGIRDAAIARYVAVASECPEDRQEQLLTNLFHMHVNRLFADDQRAHEWVVYEYLVKELYRGT